MRQHKQDKRTIVYTGKIWANLGITTRESNDKSSSDVRCVGLTTGNRIPPGKGGRIILVHAETENGFICDVELLYFGKKYGDYHDEMDGKMYHKYFTEKQL